MSRSMLALAAMLSLLSRSLQAGDPVVPSPCEVVFPLVAVEGVGGDDAIVGAVSAVPSVSSAKVLDAQGGGKVLSIRLRDGASLRFSDVSRSLDQVSSSKTRAAGAGHCQVDGESLRLASGVVLVLAGISDEQKIRAAIQHGANEIDGVVVVSRDDGCFARLSVQNGSTASFMAIVKALEGVGGKVVDLVTVAPRLVMNDPAGDPSPAMTAPPARPQQPSYEEQTRIPQPQPYQEPPRSYGGGC